MTDKFSQLKGMFAEIADLQAASGVLQWDQETYMPSGAGGARAEALATVEKAAHARLICDELARLLDEVEPWAQKQGQDSIAFAFLRAARREQSRAKKLPADLVSELAKATSLAIESWREARKRSDFKTFLPQLEQVMALNRRKAEVLAAGPRLYDSLLDIYEPGAGTSQIEPVFRALRAGLVPLVREIQARKDKVSDALLHGDCDEAKQYALCQEVVKLLGFDFERGRQDLSAHPFTTPFSVSDVRITTRVAKGYLPTALYGSIHECGHALYAQGIDPELDRSPLNNNASMGVDESQSRLWENVVGRGRPFCAWLLPRLRQYFPDRFSGCGAEDLYRALNKSGASLIRIEADEVTYNLHIMLRFEMESDLIEGRLKPADAPAAWNAKTTEYLGITPADDRDGVLQDIHWPAGLIGYFPTYTLGNIMAAQFYAEARKGVPDLEGRIRAGDFAVLRGWLKENVHKHGRRYTADELLKRVTGKGLDAAPFLDYLRGKYSELYGFKAK
jgi:carboxypeptidase Taq